HQPLVAEDRLAAKDRENLRNNTEERQSNDVNLRVTEEPEQVLPEHGSTVFGVKYMSSESPVSTQCEQRGCQRREGHHDQTRCEQRVPCEDRHTPHGHARGTHADNGGDEVDGTENGTET